MPKTNIQKSEEHKELVFVSLCNQTNRYNNTEPRLGMYCSIILYN